MSVPPIEASDPTDKVPFIEVSAATKSPAFKDTSPPTARTWSNETSNTV